MIAMYEWLLFSLCYLTIWAVIYLIKPKLRKEMMYVSAFTSLTGLTEPIFVPAYWSPPSLFNLTARTGFDIESIIFSFAMGGIASVLYEAVLNLKHRKLDRSDKRRWLHFASLASIPFVFTALMLMKINPIYAASMAMLVGGFAATLCRPDLARNAWLGGALLTGLYFTFFLFMVTAFPDFISAWNLSALSGILVLGVPFEELMYAFTFGMLWSGIYEHIKGYRLVRT
jgi:hypothetical protein